MCRISSPKRGRKCRWKPGWCFLARGEYGKTRNENPYFGHIRSFVCCEGPAGLAVGAGLCPAQKPSAEVPATAARELPRENPPLVSNTPQRYSWYKGARSLSLHISTYLRTPRGRFIDVFSMEAERQPTKAYLEGAIELVLSGKAVLNQSLWRKTGEASMDFPDQPLTATLTRREREWLRFEVRNWQGELVTASSVQETALFALLKREGPKTLARLAELNPANAASHERALAALSR